MFGVNYDDFIERNEISAFINESNGNIIIGFKGHNITLITEELPERYQTFFAKYLLSKE